MVYTILISIVFIAELIIAITIVQILLRLDKTIIELDETIENTRPGITDICELIRKISEQWTILSQDFVDKTKKESEDILLNRLSKFLVGTLILNLNFKFIKIIKKSKIAKTISKGLSLLETMV